VAKTYYVALVRKENSVYGVEFPDFPGCITCGQNLEEAVRMAAEALNLHIDGIWRDGGMLLPPLSPGMVDIPDNAIVFVLPADVSKFAGRGKGLCVSIKTIPDW